MLDFRSIFSFLIDGDIEDLSFLFLADALADLSKVWGGIVYFELVS